MGRYRRPSDVDAPPVAHARAPFDSPPVVPVIDAVLLHDLAGATLVVVGVDRATRSHVGSAIRSLERGGAAIVGFVLNKVADRADGGYYEYERRPPSVTSVTPGATAQVRDPEVG